MILEARLRALANKAAEATATRAIAPVPLPRLKAGFPRSLAKFAVTQLYHGECLTAEICETLAKRATSPAAKACLEWQVNDERIHAALYHDYLSSLGGPGPRGALFDSMNQAVANWDGPSEALPLAIHVLLEGEAIALQQAAGKWLPCPVFADLNRDIAHDEARHIAFAKIYLPEALPHLSRTDRLNTYLWLRQIWYKSVELASGEGRLARWVVGDRLKSWARERWTHWQQELVELGLYSEEEREFFLKA